MGWAYNDGPRVIDARIALSKSKAELYVLHKHLHSIEHSEKGPNLRRMMKTISDSIIEIEMELNR
jgi:hypothetical protein